MLLIVQKTVAYLALLVLMVPNLLCMFVQKDFWPYSRYPMFSAPPPPDGIKGEFHMTGVLPNGERVIFSQYSPNNVQFMAGHHFRRIQNQPDSAARLHDLGVKLGRRYNSQLPPDKRMRTVEFCRFDYRVDPDGQIHPDAPTVSVLERYELD